MAKGKITKAVRVLAESTKKQKKRTKAEREKDMIRFNIMKALRAHKKKVK